MRTLYQYPDGVVYSTDPEHEIRKVHQVFGGRENFGRYWMSAVLRRIFNPGRDEVDHAMRRCAALRKSVDAALEETKKHLADGVTLSDVLGSMKVTIIP